MKTKSKVSIIMLCLSISFLFLSFGGNTVILKLFEEFLQSKLLDLLETYYVKTYLTQNVNIIHFFNYTCSFLKQCFSLIFHVLTFIFYIVYIILKQPSKKVVIINIVMASLLLVLKPLISITQSITVFLCELFSLYIYSNVASVIFVISSALISVLLFIFLIIAIASNLKRKIVKIFLIIILSILFGLNLIITCLNLFVAIFSISTNYFYIEQFIIIFHKSYFFIALLIKLINLFIIAITNILFIFSTLYILISSLIEYKKKEKLFVISYFIVFALSSIIYLIIFIMKIIRIICYIILLAYFF